jgi:hypothetical protein
MSTDETTEELRKLREEVATLQDARREKESLERDRQDELKTELKADDSVAEAAAATADAAEISVDDKSQLDELAELLQAEIKDLPTITCLAVFSLGILMGRLMR